MPYNLFGKSVLSLKDYDKKALMFVIELAFCLKQAKLVGNETKYLNGKELGLIFEKHSTRTRCAFEIAIFDQGANLTYISSETSHMGVKETIKDTARVLGRYYNAIVYRGFGQDIVEQFNKHAGVPVFNALTDDFHPTQMLADLLTMIESSKKRVEDISYCYIGDARSNMGNSMLLLGAIAGMDVRIIAPKELWPNKAHIDICKEYAKLSRAKITMTEDMSAVKGVDFVHTDVWVSMGEPIESWGKRIKQLLPYQVNKKVMDSIGNHDVKFMHCLPAFHNTELDMVKKIAEQYPALKNGIEVTEDVFESDMSIVFDQAENRMHSIKAMLVASLGNI